MPISSLTRADFEERFLKTNLPVVLTGATSGWRAAREWVTASGAPDMQLLAEAFRCTSRDGSQRKPQIEDARDVVGRLRKMVGRARWRQRWQGRSGRVALSQGLASCKPRAVYGAYTTPQCLGEDWLNEHWAEGAGRDQDATNDDDGDDSSGGGGCGGDHRFVYVGPSGSQTALHADVLFSYSWSANVVGRKQWLLVPAEQRHLVGDEATRPLKPDLRELLTDGSDAADKGRPAGGTDWPRLTKGRRGGDGEGGTEGHGVTKLTQIEIIQQAGDLIFVPSGWYHQVCRICLESLGACIRTARAHDFCLVCAISRDLRWRIWRTASQSTTTGSTRTARTGLLPGSHKCLLTSRRAWERRRRMPTYARSS